MDILNSTLGILFFLNLASANFSAIPNEVSHDPVNVQFFSTPNSLDAPKIRPHPNDITFDWWYFDAVSTTTNESIVIVFYLSTNTAFPFLRNNSAISVDIFASFNDGSPPDSAVVNSPAGEAGTAFITTHGDGASGVWAGTGWSFEGAGDLSRYTVTVDAPSLGINGTLTLECVRPPTSTPTSTPTSPTYTNLLLCTYTNTVLSTQIAPPHYPCSPACSSQNQTLLVAPHIGWSNALPDSLATASFTWKNNRTLSFTGTGYHDKNWSDRPFVQSVRSWYWGHGRLGPYSVVWFDTIDSDGVEWVSGYVALDGEVLMASCAPNSTKVRPVGRDGGNGFPPRLGMDQPEGFEISFVLGNGERLKVVVSAGVVVADNAEGLYTRWIGEIKGGFVGGEDFTGVALFEEFVLV